MMDSDEDVIRIRACDIEVVIAGISERLTRELAVDSYDFFKSPKCPMMMKLALSPILAYARRMMNGEKV